LPDATSLARERLERLYATFDHAASAADPVHLVRRYEAPEDREVAGLLAASLAFGRVASVLRSIEALLAVLGPRPSTFVRRFDPMRDRRAVEPLGHRWIRGRDLAALVLVLRRMLEEGGSIEAFFVRGDDPGAPDVGPALESFSTRALDTDLAPVYGRRPGRRRGVRFFFPRPSAGSACKRLNLFLRWMVRKDAIDLGVWRRVSPARLVVPLDTHVIRVGRCLRLTRYRSPGWKMAADITASLRALEPRDPVRYDFSLCHVGMMGACAFGRGRAQAKSPCPLRGMCSPGGRAQSKGRP
jgi:uncharacterized protein (TIGR02757 family)